MKLKINQKAPDFKLPDQDGKIHKLSDYKGKWVLIYFYPKDNTPGCTKEACEIRDNFSSFQNLNIVVLGISADSIESHKKFKNKYNLPFVLLSDSKKEVAEKYDVLWQKKFMGKTINVVLRKSFLINPQGKIEKIYEDVKPEKHAKEVLEDFSKINE